MHQCNKCLENNWGQFIRQGDTITATCQECGNEISWIKQFVSEVGDLCRYCKTPVMLKELRFYQKKLRKPYYYTHALYCNNCGKQYLIDKYKVIN